MNLGAIPWASLAANRSLVAWLDRQPARRGAACLVIGCGLGDDAEELARCGYRVTAFDVSPTAIALCRKRFPGSAVDYVVEDLFAAPSVWSASFGLVVEIRTLQSLPPSRRREAARAIARTVEPGGQAFVRCAAREAEEPLTSRPWPLTRRELQAFTGVVWSRRRSAMSRRRRVQPGCSRRSISGPRPVSRHEGAQKRDARSRARHTLRRLPHRSAEPPGGRPPGNDQRTPTTAK